MGAHYARPLATLIGGGDPPALAHVPLRLDRERQVLRGHVGRANPIWRGFDGVRPVTVVVQGPDVYISPRFYASAGHVPTWNYAIVRVRGAARVLDRDEDRQEVLRSLSERHEAGRPEPWSVDELSPAWAAELRAAIVAFEVPLDEAVGAFKLSQNRAPADRDGVRRALAGRATADDLAVLRWMEPAVPARRPRDTALAPVLRRLLRLEIDERRDLGGCGPTLEALCLRLHLEGHLDDVFLLYEAKFASFDAGCMIEGDLLTMGLPRSTVMPFVAGRLAALPDGQRRHPHLLAVLTAAFEHPTHASPAELRQSVLERLGEER
ncbi:MAG: hypothetical protein EOO75_03290 [Myxococcales bacterium]|nr:MAG: hypothetical protein EOO75_03290 [Myxococcales bacterium]